MKARKFISILLIFTLIFSSSTVSLAQKSQKSTTKTVQIDSVTEEFYNLSDDDIVIYYEGVPIYKRDVQEDLTFEMAVGDASIESLPDVYRLPLSAESAVVRFELDIPQYYQTRTYSYLSEDEKEYMEDDLVLQSNQYAWVWVLAGIAALTDYYVFGTALGAAGILNTLSSNSKTQLSAELSTFSSPVVMSVISSSSATITDVHSWDGEYVNLEPEYTYEELLEFSYGYVD